MLKAMPKLLVTRLDAELVEAVDGLVRDGIVANRSEAVRIGLEQLVDRSRRSEIGAAIVEGYRRVPQTDQGLGRADNGLRALVAEEPW
jgi:Arc/MetJ-type ribon-helix-helix transcriptional regulator